MDIIFMSTPEFGVGILEKLNKNFNIISVVTGIDKARGRGKKLKFSPIKEKALELGLEVFQPKDVNSQESIEYLKSKKADLFVVVAYGQILKSEVLDIPKYYSVNIHASLLPKLRGAAPINRAILNGDGKSGVTIMKMEEGLDTGDISLQSEIEIGDKNAIELEEELSKLGGELIVDFINKLEKGNISFIKQEENLSTYAHKIEKEDAYIDFDKQNTVEIIRTIKGIMGRDAASTTYKGIRFKISGAEIKNRDISGKPGEIINSHKKLEVATKDGSILITRLKFPGKKEMDIKSFLAGNSFDEGEVLGG
ncbi:MAG: methionyl-tRNA formyltransferase [Peptoniphilaceae bacterium]